MKTVSKACAELVGVDFSSDESFVSDRRSPMIVNMYKDYTQNFNTAVETRPGFRIDKAFNYEIERAFTSKNLPEVLFVYANAGIYLYCEHYNPLKIASVEQLPYFVDFFGYILAYAGEQIFKFEFQKVEAGADRPQHTAGEEGFIATKYVSNNTYVHIFDVSQHAFVPLTYMTARDGTVTPFQGVNLLTGKQKNYVQVDGETNTITLLPYKPDEDVEIVSVLLNGEETTAYTNIGNVVSFATTPTDMSEIEIIFSQEIENTIAKCNVFYCFDERVFAGGYSNTYFWSGLSDPLYFPILAYESVDNGPVLGFFQTSSNLLIASKNQTSICSTVVTNMEGLPKTYPNYAISSTYGGRVCGEFLNDPIMLTRYGLMGISSVDYYGERNIFTRSTLVNGKLTNEADLENASMCTFREYLMICVNGNIYLANSRETFRNPNDTIEYEWYYWTGIGVEEDGIFFPAKQILESNDKLFFVTENGYVGIFNTDMMKESCGKYDGELLSKAYADDIATIHDGEAEIGKKAIFSCYVTGLDDFGYRGFRKNSRKVGNLCDLKAFAHTRCKIKARSSTSAFQDVGAYVGDYMDFVDIDFSNFTFRTSDLATFFFKPSLKKFQKSQLMLYSDEIYEPFGVLGVYQEIEVCGYAK